MAWGLTAKPFFGSRGLFVWKGSKKGAVYVGDVVSETTMKKRKMEVATAGGRLDHRHLGTV